MRTETTQKQGNVNGIGLWIYSALDLRLVSRQVRRTKQGLRLSLRLCLRSRLRLGLCRTSGTETYRSGASNLKLEGKRAWSFSHFCRERRRSWGRKWCYVKEGVGALLRLRYFSRPCSYANGERSRHRVLAVGLLAPWKVSQLRKKQWYSGLGGIEVKCVHEQTFVKFYIFMWQLELVKWTSSYYLARKARHRHH